MASERRRARGAAHRVGIPAPLLSDADPLWLRDDWPEEFEQRFGVLPTRGARDRFSGTGEPPFRRRVRAAEAWGVANGMTRSNDPHMADWHQLRAAGLVPDSRHKSTHSNGFGANPR